MPVIYCYIEPFVGIQKIYESPNGVDSYTLKERISLENLPEYFAANAANCKIIIHSISKNLSEGYAEEIRNYALTKYGLNNIEIEVVK